MSTYNSSGKCFFCNTEVSKTSITRHLNGHLAKEVIESRKGTSFHVRIEEDGRGGGSGLYFLNLWVDGDALMDEIDSFLRQIWLECCGHMSSFTYSKEKKLFWTVDNILEEADDMMDAQTKDILKKGLKLKYDYDFGSTTRLVLTVLEQFRVSVPGDIILLSRNEPLEIICETCNLVPASVMCTVCYGETNTFCKKCAKKHAKICEDFSDYSAMPVVNSPRMGVCGYDGGTIDKKRDGIFVKK